MKAILLSMTLFVITQLSMNAEVIKSESKVVEATIFFSGAELVHKSEAQLKKGSNSVIIRGLASYVDANSIRIKANNGVLVSSFEYIIESGDNDEILAMRSAIAMAQNELDKIRSEIRINSELKQMLNKSIEKSVSGGENGLSIEDVMKAMDYYDKKNKDIETSLFAQRDREKEMVKKIEEMNRDLNAKIQQVNLSRGALKLTVTSPSAAKCTFDVSYFTRSASWEPYHDINVKDIDTPIKITSKARVIQTTGIEWNQVKIRLSTSVPSSGKNAPLFSPWILQDRPVARVMSDAMRVQNKVSYSEVMEVAAVNYSENIDVQAVMDNYVVLNENAVNVTYDIDLPYTIPGDGSSQNIELRNQEIQGRFKHYCAPKLDINTYMIAEIDNWERLNLLSGRANITYDGTLTGDTYINASSTMATLTLTLGIDKRVAVKREKINEMSSTRTLGGDIKQEFTYRVTVRNNANKGIDMILKDQYPISNQKSVVVELLKETTPPSFNVEEVGVLTWENKISAGETKTYTISYSVKYPKNTSLNL